MTSNTFLVLGAILALSSCASAFFLDWGSSDKTSPAPTHYIYHRRLNQGPVSTYVLPENNQRQQIPSIPVQVPLQAQMSPISNVHNVQLVPCLCPVSQDFSYDNQPIQQENFYFNGVPVQQIPQQHIQQQIQQPQPIVQQQP